MLVVKAFKDYFGHNSSQCAISISFKLVPELPIWETVLVCQTLAAYIVVALDVFIASSSTFIVP